MDSYDIVNSGLSGGNDVVLYDVGGMESIFGQVNSFECNVVGDVFDDEFCIIKNEICCIKSYFYDSQFSFEDFDMESLDFVCMLVYV